MVKLQPGDIVRFNEDGRKIVMANGMPTSWATMTFIIKVKDMRRTWTEYWYLVDLKRQNVTDGKFPGGLRAQGDLLERVSGSVDAPIQQELNFDV